MNNSLEFSTREEFRNWLIKNCLSKDGIWLLFSKTSSKKTIRPADALEEALCFGWIDGQIKRIDELTYIKYFSMRRNNSKWSEKNKALVQKLEDSGLMTAYGRSKVLEAKKNGQWDASNYISIEEEQVSFLADLLKKYEPCYTHFMSMSSSVKKTYTKAYFDAKTPAGREKRIAWMVERLNKNLKPM